jgi:7-alpha-hydroxysteroid dehydrogenase
VELVTLERFRLDGRVAVVAGGGRGIGAACARTLAEAGADVVVGSRTPSQVEAVCGQIREMGRRSEAVVTDLTDLANLPRLIDMPAERFGRLDILVNTIGAGTPMPFTQLTPSALVDSLHGNAVVAFELTRLAVPHMLSVGKGAIVHTSSTMGHVRDRGYSAYGTGKAAVEHLTRQLAIDLAPRIRVNAVSPGAIETEALRGVLTEQMRSSLRSLTPLHRIGDPDDVALAVLYLVSDAADYVTGKVLHVDGGQEASNLPLPIPDL